MGKQIFQRLRDVKYKRSFQAMVNSNGVGLRVCKRQNHPLMIYKLFDFKIQAYFNHAIISFYIYYQINYNQYYKLSQQSRMNA